MSSQFMVFGQTKNDEKKLNSMFWSGNYKEIILDYALLYNKDRKNLDVNFKYGTCLLFESDSLSTMNKAIGHLTFACASEESLAEYHYFLGRALHRIADYNGALKQFELYKRKKTKTTAALDADLFISYCSNALNLKELANASYSKTGTIIPAEIGKSYNLNQIDLSGKFFNSIEFQSKIDKKRNYEPLIYKPENATLRFYASFGDKDEGNKDIYMVSGSYEDKKITRLSSIINSNSDEALPVFDEKTHYLYFSSLGHNSSGGYDIYRSKLDSITNEFSVPENLGQGISTPYDDFLFMYNSSNNKSLITSTKLSPDGELSIFQGTISFLESKKNSSNLVQVQFNNGGNNAIKLTTILVKDSLNNTITQVTKSSEKEAVELNLPPGTYRYFIELSGSKDFFEAQIVIPEKQETISQIIEYSIDDLNTELVRINQPDSSGNSTTRIAKNISPTDGNQTIGATVIDEKLEKEVLEKLNLENFSQVEVIDAISDRIIEFELTQKENEELADRLNLAIVNNQEYYQQLQEEIDSISKELDETTNIEKIEKLKYIQNTLAEQEEILQQTIWLQALNDSIRNDIKNKTDNFNTVQSIGKNLTELTQQENEAEAYKLILDNYQSINSLSATSALKKNYNDLLDVELELSRLDKKIIQLTNDKIKLDEDLKQAEINARNASKKEKINLDQSITEIKQKIVSIEKQINKYKLDKSELSILKTDKELKRNILSSILKEGIDESLSYETALKHYLPSSINIRSKTNEINLQLNETEGKLTSNEINYLNQRKLYLSKKEILSENYPNQEQLIQIEKEYVESIKSLIEQTKNSDTTLFTEFLNEKLQESSAKLQALQEEQNPNEITKSDVTHITPDKTDEKQDENQNKPEKDDEITKSDVTQITPDKSDEKQDENQNKPEKIDEITKSDVTQITPDKSDEKQDENQNKPEKIDEITKSNVTHITPDKTDEKQDENQNKPEKIDEITKSDVTKNQDLSNEILSQELPEKSNVLIDATVTDLRNSTNEIKKEKSSIYREIQVSHTNLPLYSIEKLKHDEALLIDQLKRISDEINLTKNNKASNKNKIINKELEQSITELEIQQDELLTKLTNIQIELEKQNLSEINIGMNSNTVDLDITKQQEIASTQEYRNYVEQLVAFENSSRNLKLINDTIALIQAAIDQEITYLLLNPEKEKGRIIIEQLIQQLEVQVSKRNNISSNLTAIKREINRIEETSPINKNDLRYLASARIEPIKKIASSPEQDIIPKTGFNLNAQESYYSSKNPIPQNVKPPSGLVYRVQVGAFRKPIPQNLYSAFNPVSGELAPNGLTLYMAGYFNSSNNAVSARKQIQQLGYTDAFVVAYCNGRKISLGEARQLESRGECVPLDSNQFILEIVQRTKEAMSNQGISVVDLPNDIKKSSNLDLKDPQKLYYTVQVGVYNQLINEKIKFPALSEIATHKIATGQIRYSTGKFTDLSSAKVRKEKAVQSGIKDAFIVAYYNGERITIAAANELLSRYGDSILFSFPSTIVQPANETAYQIMDKKYFTNSEITFEPELKRYQTIDEFENFPLEKLAYFNQFGLFQYNPATKKIESTSYTNVFDLDNSIKLSGYFSQLNFKPSISTTEMEENISGDLADFMLHSHSVQQIRSKDNIHIDFEKSYFNDANYTNMLKNTFQLIIK